MRILIFVILGIFYWNWLAKYSRYGQERRTAQVVSFINRFVEVERCFVLNTPGSEMMPFIIKIIFPF